MTLKIKVQYILTPYGHTSWFIPDSKPIRSLEIQVEINTTHTFIPCISGYTQTHDTKNQVLISYSHTIVVYYISDFKLIPLCEPNIKRPVIFEVKKYSNKTTE